jgi:hypothetical protein
MASLPGIGAVAQLGERCNRTAEVVSSNLISSTILEYSIGMVPAYP